MEFRAPTIAAQENASAIKYLTNNLRNPQASEQVVTRLIEELGNSVSRFPIWHPILTAAARQNDRQVFSRSALKLYKGSDHTVDFIRGFVTCPYSESVAEEIVAAVREVPSLNAYRLDEPLYSDMAFPVVVEARDVELEADGTIRSRDALAWFTQQIVANAEQAEVAETWWNLRTEILGQPHGARSSLFVNQHVGLHMRKILEALNDSGMFGPVLESSLDMLSQKKRRAICETLLRAAVNNWDKNREQFQFDLRGETCQVGIRDTWDDGTELSIRVGIGDHDLDVSGFYYPAKDEVQSLEPSGKRRVAEKFA